MSDDQYSHLGLALVAVMVAIGTFAAGYYNGVGLTGQEQTAAVVNATAVSGAPVSTSFSKEEIEILRGLLKGVVLSDKDDCEDLYQASIDQSHAAIACYDKWEKKCNPLQNPPRPGTRLGRACEALVQACNRMQSLANDLNDAYNNCVEGSSQTS